MQRLGEVLVRKSVITPEQLVEANRFDGRDLPLGRKLVRLGYLTEETLLGHFQREFAFPRIHPAEIRPEPEALGLVPPEIARKHEILPIAVTPSTVTIVTADPSDRVALDSVKFLTGRTVKIALAPGKELRRALRQHYDPDGEVYAKVLSKLSDSGVEVLNTDPEIDLEALERATAEAPIVQLVNVIFARAAEMRASDIHVEPAEKTLRIRFRIDGVLHDVMQPPPSVRNALASRVKIMSSLDIAERRLPQDGALKVRLGSGRELSFRVSVMPTVFGEKVVLRLLDEAALEVDVGRIGLDERSLRLFRHAIHRPFGMVLVTGPTGSGKSTTLYSAVSELNDAERNISTAEDPVEIKLDGISQLQVNEEIGLTFARALRTFLRQDPDVIMVGEIRDTETAEIAIRAALTGHLVLSTLHTNDAPSAIGRYLDMGVEPFLIASSLHLVVAQRLVRRICTHCRVQAEIPPPTLATLGIASGSSPGLEIWHGAGCDECAGTGYCGRIALFEVMPISPRLRRMTIDRASSEELRAQAVAEGMTTLRQSGVARLLAGLTTVEEVLRVTTSDED